MSTQRHGARIWLQRALGCVALAACGSDSVDVEVEEARAVPMAQSPAARALRLPRMRPQPSRTATPADRPVTVRVRILLDGSGPPDTTVQARSFDAECGETFVDTAVVRNAGGILDALVWVEGATALITDGTVERRPTVQLEACRLRPRLQLAAPGSTILLVMRDSLAESLVIVPSSPLVPVDTVPFTMDGQLVPVQHRADSAGVLAIYASRLPWARSFIAVAPPAASALTDRDGRAQFTVDGRGGTVTIRAWHPSLGIVAKKLTLPAGQSDYELTLTYRR
jgi:hypothetical protein